MGDNLGESLLFLLLDNLSRAFATYPVYPKTFQLTFTTWFPDESEVVTQWSHQLHTLRAYDKQDQLNITALFNCTRYGHTERDRAVRSIVNTLEASLASAATLRQSPYARTASKFDRIISDCKDSLKELSECEDQDNELFYAGQVLRAVVLHSVGRTILESLQDHGDRLIVQPLLKHMFTAWGDNFDLLDEISSLEEEHGTCATRSVASTSALGRLQTRMDGQKAKAIRELEVSKEEAATMAKKMEELQRENSRLRDELSANKRAHEAAMSTLQVRVRVTEGARVQQTTTLQKQLDDSRFNFTTFRAELQNILRK
jgi:hypothetical protein